MSIKRKFSNISDVITIEEPHQLNKGSILCEYYLWVRWCNIREINGYYIYNGMKGNKLSFVHQQNRKLIIYFHTLISDNLFNLQHQNEHSYSFFSTHHPSFLPQSSIPENREEDDHEIKLNLTLESPSSSSHSQTFSNTKEYSIMATNGNHSNDSTPCSSPPQSPPPQSPRDKLSSMPSRRSQPKLTPGNSIDEYLYNHWVIKYENDILYYTKDKEDSHYDNEYPPSYGWKYNEKNQSLLPKQYLENANDLINFGAPPPGITRIPIIPEPMITYQDVYSDPSRSNVDKNGYNHHHHHHHAHGDSHNVYPHGSFNGASHIHKNGNNGYNGYYNQYSKDYQYQPPFVHIPTPFDLPVQMLDIVFNANSNEPLGFGIRVDVDSQILEVNNIKTECMAYQVGLKQGDIIIAVNEEDIGKSASQGLEKLKNCHGMVTMTVCRRIFDHIMIIVKGAEKDKCNGKYYFHHLDEYDSPVFMQDILQNEDAEDSIDENHDNYTFIIDELTQIDTNTNTDKDNNNNNNKDETHPMIIRKAHYETETGESLWTLSDKNGDYYIGLSIDLMPPNDNWEAVNLNQENDSPSFYSQAPTLIFYNRNQKMVKQPTLMDHKSGRYIEDHEIPMNKAQLLKSFAHPSQSYHDPNLSKLNHSSLSPQSTPPIPPSNEEIDTMLTSHYRIPSWKKNQTPWDLIMKEEFGFNNNGSISLNTTTTTNGSSATPMTTESFPAMIMDEINKQSQLHDEEMMEAQLTISKLQEFGLKWKEEVYEWKTKYKQLQRKCSKMELSSKEYEKNACILYENLQDTNQTFYDYWLVNKKQRQEIDRLKDVISQHRNRFIIIKKELLQQKRREEDLLDKINSYQTHSRQVSSISALFDDDYKLDIEELQELHITAARERELDMILMQESNDIDEKGDDQIEFRNDGLDETKMNGNNNNNNNKDQEQPQQQQQRERRKSVVIKEKLEKIELETEINELKVKLDEKDIKIRELEMEVNSWQETHSAIYDSFTSATKLYRQQVEQFNDEEKYFREKNLDLEKHLEILTRQLKKSRHSIEKTENDKHYDQQRERRYTDIEEDMEYNSDSSSSDDSDDSIDSIGGGRHVRRGSKPWMNIKKKFEKKRKKEKERNDEIKDKSEEVETPTAQPNGMGLTRIPSIATSTPTSTNDNSPPPPQPNSKNSSLTPENGQHLQAPYLQTLASQQEYDTLQTPNFDQLKEDKLNDKGMPLTHLAVEISNTSRASADTVNTVNTMNTMNTVNSSEIVSSPEMHAQALIPTTSILTIDSADLRSPSGNSTPTHIERLTVPLNNMSTTIPPRNGIPLEHVDTALSIDFLETPGSDINAPSLPDHSGLDGHQTLPSLSQNPIMQHLPGQSHVSNSMFDGNVTVGHSQLGFRASNISVISREDSVLNERYDEQLNLLRTENDSLRKIIEDWENKEEQEQNEKSLSNEWESKYNQLRIENEYMIESRMKLLTNTASEITKLKRCINVVLNICVNNNNNEMKQVITKMLKSA